jgi:hypothetical protein
MRKEGLAVGSKEDWMFGWRPLAFFFLLLTPTVVGGLDEAAFYVATDGSDTYPGTLGQPFATLDKARSGVRDRIKGGLEEDVLVLIRGGTYHLEKPFFLGPKDSGTREHSITYAAYPGERVVLSAGRPITGWKAGPDDRWTVELPAVREGRWWFRQLYADGQRLPRGRYPETGFLKLRSLAGDHRELECATSLPFGDLGGKDAEIVVVQNWSISREIITANSPTAVTTRTPMGWVGHSACYPKPGMSVFLEHAPGFVKKAGQWYLDRGRGLLLYQGLPGEDPNRRRFVAPVLERLLIIEGTRQAPVRNVHFQGIEFMHTAWQMPEIGYGGIQACYHGTEIDKETFATTVAIDMSHGQGCSLTRCRLLHMGGSGVGLGAGCQDNRIVGCEIGDLGATGANIGHMRVKKPLWVDWQDPGDVPAGNEISNCYIHHCGQELWGAHGIFDAMTRDTRIRHNEVAWIPYGGVATGFIWNTDRTSQQNCLIEYNHIHDVMLKLNDSGCIYTLGFQPGSIIRGNLLHGVRIGGFAGGRICNNGIFFDQGSKGFLLEDNVIFDVDQKEGALNTPVRFHQSNRDWHIWINNTIETGPEIPEAGKALIEKVGLEPGYRLFLKGGK